MLGRLRMSIKEAIAAYKVYAPLSFEVKWWTKSKTSKFAGHELSKYAFSGENLKKAVIQLLRKHGEPDDLHLKEDGASDCKV